MYVCTYIFVFISKVIVLIYGPKSKPEDSQFVENHLDSLKGKSPSFVALRHPLYSMIIPPCSKLVILFLVSTDHALLDSTSIICYAPSPCLMQTSLFSKETEGDGIGSDWRQKQFHLDLLPHACIIFRLAYFNLKGCIPRPIIKTTFCDDVIKFKAS